MKTQEQIRAELDRLLEEDRLEEAAELAEQIVPVSAEEFRRRLDEAPLDDEPVTAEQRRRLDALHAALAQRQNPGRRAG